MVFRWAMNGPLFVPYNSILLAPAPPIRHNAQHITHSRIGLNVAPEDPANTEVSLPMTPQEATLKDLILHDIEVLRLRSLKDPSTHRAHVRGGPKSPGTIIEEYRALKAQRLIREQRAALEFQGT